LSVYPRQNVSTSMIERNISKYVKQIESVKCVQEGYLK
jgi:hypothetical protein